MENQKVKTGGSKGAMTMGFITLIFSLLPLLSAWCMLLTSFNYFLAPLGVIFGVVAIIKSQPKTKAIIGILLCALAFCMPYLLAEQYAASAVESVSNAVETLGGISGLE